MTTQTETTQTTTAQEVSFEIVTIDGAIYRKGEKAPVGTVTTASFGANISVCVESYAEVGDWIEIQLSDGYAVAFPESRIARVVTRTL
ncbi:hypothetical protein ABZ826_23950 [Streptomyces sp. NPDC047515]|uniref:hypothetical protein n=1 Tax=Streptomyces sp. NPDC047515 TaxID=3155380 RepID=UPI0034114C43